MSCCGEPKKPSLDEFNRPPPQQEFSGQQWVNQQPGPQPMLEKPPGMQQMNGGSYNSTEFHPPPLASPPPTMSFMNGSMNGSQVHMQYQQQQQQQQLPQGAWSPPPVHHTPSPPPTTSSPYQTTTAFSADSHSLRPSSLYQSSFGGMGPPAPISPPPMTATPFSSLPPTTRALPPDEGKMSVSIDFGTTFSGVAYGSSRIAGGKVQQILNWPGSFETFRKIPTCLLYDEHGQVLAWGIEAKNASPMPGTIRCEWFKLFLEPNALRDQSNVDPRLPQLPAGKQAVDLIIDFLGCLWDYAREQITRDIGAVADLNSADVWLTVPAAWDAKGCDLMRDAAIQAGLVQSSRAGDKEWRDRLRIITEPEAAAVHCAHLTDLHMLKPSQNFIVCDAGGGTVDLAVYKIIGQMQRMEIAEIAARSGANCGSLFLDLRFQELVKSLLNEHPVHLDSASLAYFMHSFSETDKLNYEGSKDDEHMFHFDCFNVEDPDDPSVGLINGQLSIPGALLRREVFDPVVDQVINLIEEQLSKVHQRIDALMLVGGFAGSEYLKQRVEAQFSTRIRVIARPADADTATLRGAARYGLARTPLVSSVIAPRSYLMKVKLPAEQEDWMKRPAYIRNNDAGFPICENRLQYLVQKGAIVRKGQRLATKFCKFSQVPQDSNFVAVLYTSDSENIMRYTDEGETHELCKWTVDLSTLPVFQQNLVTSPSGGFYTEFEIALELDSAEVRGLLLNNGQEAGRVTFDFLN